MRIEPGFVTRFAPSPTGYLHLGHVVNALWVWNTARRFGGRVLLRIEDHDRTRCRPEYERALLEDLEWLGLEADIAPVASFRAGHSAYRQSDCGANYEAALERLRAAGEPMPEHVFGTTHGRAAYATDPDGHVVELWTWDVSGHLATLDDS